MTIDRKDMQGREGEKTILFVVGFVRDCVTRKKTRTSHLGYSSLYAMFCDKGRFVSSLVQCEPDTRLYLDC